MKRKDVINKYGESAFDGKVGGYIGICALQWLVMIICLAIGAVAFIYLNRNIIETEEDIVFLPKDQIVFFVAGFVILYFFFFVGTAWASCISLKWTFKHTVISGFRLYFDGKAIQLLGNCLKWFFLTVVTLGIYSLWLFIKYKQWEVKHTKIDNSVENANFGNGTPEFICPPVYVQPMMPQFPSYPSQNFNCPYKNNKK